MTLDAELLEILVCPNDRGDVEYLEAEQVIVCRTCGYRYPVRDGIPVMLIDEAEKPDGSRRAEAVTDLDDVGALRARATPATCSAPSPRCPPTPRVGYDGGDRRDRPSARRRRHRGRVLRHGRLGRRRRRAARPLPRRLGRAGRRHPRPGAARVLRAAHPRGRARRTRATRPRRSRASEEARARGCRVVRDHLGGHARRTRPTEPASPSVPRPGGYHAAGGARPPRVRAARVLEAVGLLPPARRRRRARPSACSSRWSAPLGARGAAGRERRQGARVAHRRSRSRSIWGAEGIGAVAAARWKAQMNENAKVPAWASALPELDHNEVVGWTDGRGRELVRDRAPRRGRASRRRRAVPAVARDRPRCRGRDRGGLGDRALAPRAALLA